MRISIIVLLYASLLFVITANDAIHDYDLMTWMWGWQSIIMYWSAMALFIQEELKKQRDAEPPMV